MKLEIFCGRAKPLTAVGKNQCHLLGFAERYPTWHGYAYDRGTVAAINGLEKRGSIKVNRETRQFAIIYAN